MGLGYYRGLESVVNLRLDTVGWRGILVISQINFGELSLVSSRGWHTVAVSFKILTHLLQMAQEVHCLICRLGYITFPAIWLRIGGLLYLAKLSDLNENGLDERETF